MTQESYTIAHAESSLGWGGQEIRIYTEMLAMRNRGHRLWLFAPSESTVYARCREAGFPVFPFSVHKAFYPLTVLRLAAAFRKEKVQVVNPHSSRDGWLAGMAARLARVPLVIRSRHFDVDYPSRFLSRIAFCRLPHHVLTTSQRMAERLHLELGLERDRVTCLPTGIDTEKFHPQVQGQLRRELGLPPEATLIGMIAVLRMRKGHLQFLDAAVQLLKTDDSLHFVIAGDGGGRELLTQKINDLGLQKRVSWLGYREDVPNIMASLDILVLPSTADEGIPQAILQAHAMGKAVVGTNVEGIKEVIRDGETGLLAAPGQSESLAEKIGLLTSDPILRQTLGNRGREQALNYSLTRMCERLEVLYSRYLNPLRHQPRA